MIIKKNRLVEIIKEELARFEEVANMGADVNSSYKEGYDYEDDGYADDEMEHRRDAYEEEHGERMPNPLIKPSERLSGQEQADNFFRSMYEKGWKGPGTPWPKSE